MKYCLDYEIGSRSDVIYADNIDDIVKIINEALKAENAGPVKSADEIEDIMDELEEANTKSFD